VHTLRGLGMNKRRSLVYMMGFCFPKGSANESSKLIPSRRMAPTWTPCSTTRTPATARLCLFFLGFSPASSCSLHVAERKPAATG
jgi:hypothetical protein